MKIDHITYFGGDIEETKEFYGNILGLEVQKNDGKLWVKVGDEYIIHLSSSPEAKTGGKCHFAITEDSVLDRAKRIKERGVEVFDLVDGQKITLERIDPEIKQFFVRDPAGNLIEFIC